MRRLIILGLLLLCAASTRAAAVTHRVSTATTTACNTTSTSGAFTPAAGDLLVAFVHASDTVAVGSMTDSQNLGWDKIASALNKTSLDTTYLFISRGLAAATSMTVTFDCAGDASTGVIIEVASVSSMSRTGAAAAKQTAKSENQASGGTPAATFAASVLTGNPTLGMVGNSTNIAGLTAPTSWSELADTGYGVPTTGAEYVSRDSGFTGTTITWGSTSGSAFGVLIVELDTSSLPAAPAVPTLVQQVESPMSNQNASTMTLRLLDGTKAGNTIVVVYWFVNSAAPIPASTTVADDKSNTYQVAATFNGAHTRIQWAIAKNVAADTRSVTITFVTNQAQKAQGKVMEWYNVDQTTPFDGASVGADGTSTSLSAGLLNTVWNGDVVLHLGICDTTGTCDAGPSGTSEVGSWTQATNWTLVSADLHDGTSLQYIVQSAAGAITPTITMAPSAAWTSHAIALKAAAAGTAPGTGIRAVNLWNQRWGHNNAPNTEKFQLPNCQGNVLFFFAFGTPGLDITATPTDSASNTWTQVSTGHAGETEGFFRSYYTVNPSCPSSLIVTIQFNTLSNSGTNIFFWDIKGAATSSPFDLDAFTNGLQTVAGNVTGVSITPTTSNGIVLSVMGVLSNTINGISTPAAGLFDAPIQTPIVTQNSLAENNGWAHYYNPDTSAISWVWTTTGGAVGNWGNWAVAFKAPAAPSAAPSQLPTLGCCGVASLSMGNPASPGDVLSYSLNFSIAPDLISLASYPACDAAAGCKAGVRICQAGTSTKCADFFAGDGQADVYLIRKQGTSATQAFKAGTAQYSAPPAFGVIP